MSISPLTLKAEKSTQVIGFNPDSICRDLTVMNFHLAKQVRPKYEQVVVVGENRLTSRTRVHALSSGAARRLTRLDAEGK